MFSQKLLPIVVLLSAFCVIASCHANPLDIKPVSLNFAPQDEPLNENLTLIDLEPQKTFQTISGWEVTAQAGQNCPGFALYKDELFDLAVNDLGINRIRLEIRSGSENPVDYFARFAKGEINFDQWRPNLYEIINDNDDPYSINEGGFQFSELDRSIESVLQPLKQRVEANGELLYINLTVVDFNSGQGASNVQYQDQPEEYAELVLATFLHIQRKYGWEPNAVEVILEPDVAGWSAEQTGLALVTVAKRLEAHGFAPEYIAPSNTDMGSALNYFDQMIKLPGVLDYLTTISYHRYRGVSTANLEAIASRATQYELDTAMLEHIGSGYETLHQDLQIGRNSAWQQFALAFCTNDDGAQYFWINTEDPENPQVNLGFQTRYLHQYFKFVRSGAVRIAAESNNSVLDPLAFVNRSGSLAVIVKASRSSPFSIIGLPAGTYGINFTTDDAYNIDAADIALQNNQPLNTQIPASGVITIYFKSD